MTHQTWMARIPAVSVLVMNIGALCYMSFPTGKQIVHGKNKLLLRCSSPSTLPGHTQTKLTNTACAKSYKKQKEEGQEAVRDENKWQGRRRRRGAHEGYTEKAIKTRGQTERKRRRRQRRNKRSYNILCMTMLVCPPQKRVVPHPH